MPQGQGDDKARTHFMHLYNACKSLGHCWLTQVDKGVSFFIDLPFFFFTFQTNLIQKNGKVQV